MGVHRLQTFVEKHCFDVCEWVDIKNLANRYRSETGKTPVIVVDGHSCLRTIYGNLNWICGGQFKQFVKACIDFVKIFYEENIKLVFFFDGPSAKLRRETWVERRIQNMEDIEMIFEWLKSDDEKEENVDCYRQLPLGVGCYARFILKHLCGCDVHASIKEYDSEVAAYARRNGCFAILGQDSDFLIHNGSQYYFSITKLGLPSLHTINYNRYALARNLRITMEHLPLFASLMGNDVLTADKLKRYHEGISTPGSGSDKERDIAHSIAKYIRDIPMGNTVYTLLPLICRDVFQDPSMSDLLAESIWSYLPQPDLPLTGYNGTPWERTVYIASCKHQSGELPPSIFGILKEFPFESGAVMEDFKKGDIPPSAILLRKTRERLYSFLLHENTIPHVVEEWCASGKNSLDVPRKVKVTPINPFHQAQLSTELSGIIVLYVRHPGLRVLWDSRDDDDTMNMRWSLISWVISTEMRAGKLKLLPTNLIIPAASLFYFLHEAEENFLTKEEVDVFIVVAITLHEHSAKDLEKMVVGKPHPRGVHLATLYMRMGMHVFNVIGACGFPVPTVECLPYNYFDGKYFQSLYKQMVGGLDVTTMVKYKGNYKAQYEQVKEFLNE